MFIPKADGRLRPLGVAALEDKILQRAVVDVWNALAHNLGRWATQIGLPNQPVQTARSRRRQLLQIPGRLVRSSRTWTLRMPARWPWQTDFNTILHRIRALPVLT